MKRLSFLLLFVLISMSVAAIDVEIDGICYSLNNNTASVIKSFNSGYRGDIVIPESVVYEGKGYSLNISR